MNHLDIFLYPPNYDYLITYKLPKNKGNELAFLQNNHKLKYLTFEGLIHNNQEKIRIFKKGIFLAQSWILSMELHNIIKISWDKLIAPVEDLSKDMWKKTDFKISIEEIKLYEITEAKKTDTLISTEIIKEKSVLDSNEDKEITLSTQIPANEPKALEIQAKEKPPLADESIQASPINQDSQVVFPTPVQSRQFQEDNEIEFVPIQELVLEETGKTSGEYKSTP